MALQTINISSDSLQRMVEISVYIPTGPIPQDGYPSLTLLHGLTGNLRSWTTNSTIMSLADKYNIAIIMPSGENSFYLNNGPHQKFSDFIGSEILKHVRGLFPISDQRSKTYIGGLSMGGYGALINGLRFNDNFSAIMAFSNALLVDNFPLIVDYPFDLLVNKTYLQQIFGPLEEVSKSAANYKNYLKELNKDDIPHLYLSCGMSDMFIHLNRDLTRTLNSLDIPYTYDEIEGAHDWNTWQEMIEKALVWLDELKQSDKL